MEQNTPVTELTTFDILQSKLLELAEEHEACSDATEELESAESLEDLLQVVKDNISWCCSHIPDCADKLVAYFGNDLLLKFNIYTSGKHDINVTEKNMAIALLDSSSATVKTWDSSSATVETWDSSSATVKTWDSSSATVKTWGSSSATVKTWGSSSANIGRYHTSKLDHSLGDGICPLIKHLTEKKVFVKTTEFEIVQVSQ